MFYERGSYCIFRFVERYALRKLSSSDCKKPELTFGLDPNGNFLLSSLGTSLSIKNKLKSLHKILLSELIQLVTYRFFGRKMSIIIIPSSFINYNL